jgi:hypothetical protein
VSKDKSFKERHPDDWKQRAERVLRKAYKELLEYLENDLGYDDMSTYVAVDGIAAEEAEIIEEFD